MKTKQFSLAAAIVLFSVSTVTSQGILGGLFGGNNKNNKGTKEESKIKPVQVPLPTTEFSDPTGFSGTYHIKDTLWFDKDGRNCEIFTNGCTYKWTDEKGNPYFSNIVKFHYIKEENDNLVNKIVVYLNNKISKDAYKLDETFLKNTGLYSFVEYYGSDVRAYIQIAEGIVVYTYGSNKDYSDANIFRVFAKDRSKLDEFDKETCLALLQKKLNEGKTKEAEATKAKLMGNDVYKQMKGKIGFVNHHGNTGALYGTISEKMDVFISSVEIGKPVYYRAYYNDIPSLKCADCKKNVIFEIEGNKISLAELRKKSSAWQSKIGNLDKADNDFYSMCPTLLNRSYSNYAVLYLLYQIKSKFADGKSFKCKVTITNYRDGVDVEELATGTINLVYKSANSADVDALMELVEKVEN
ncbi:MAG: hypothetical protein N2167_03075 [Flavobacteriales bacterium]|nr:hypothetical protein [Flavobacteriales bacterium]